MPRGTNAPMVGDYNQSVILDAVRRAPSGLSQVELIELTGLSKQTVSNITRRLLDDGWFETLGVTVTGRGKPRTTIGINAGRLYAVGVHLDPSIVTAVLLDLGGTAVATASSADLLDDEPIASMARVSGLVERMIDEAGIERQKVSGVGIATPGPLDIGRGTLVHPPKLRGWDGFGVTEAVRDAFDYPTIVDKDTLVVTTGECWARDHADGASMLFMYLGTGIGCGFAFKGTVVRGLSHNAGEIGHILSDVEGTLCNCGRRGCLGRATDPHQLVADAVELGLMPASDEASNYAAIHLGLAELCHLADDGVEQAMRLLTRAANAVAEATRMLVSAHDASLVVFGGPFWDTVADHYLPVIRDRLEHTPEPRSAFARIETTVMGDAVGAVGAASLVFDEAFSTRLSTYQLTTSR